MIAIDLYMLNSMQIYNINWVSHVITKQKIRQSKYMPNTTTDDVRCFQSGSVNDTLKNHL